MLFYNIKIKKHSRDELLVNQVAAAEAPPEGAGEAGGYPAAAGARAPARPEGPAHPPPPEPPPPPPRPAPPGGVGG